jgi:hypothetical protein
MNNELAPSVQTVSFTDGGKSQILVAANAARRSIQIQPQTEACLINFGAQAGLFATGTLTFGTNPVNTETIVVNGVAFTFVTGASTSTNVHIGATKEETAQNFIDVLNASANAAINVATYSLAGAVVTVTYDTAGTDGNAYTLANSSGTVAVTRSAATLAGGSSTQGGIALATNVMGEYGTQNGFMGQVQQDIYVNSATNAAKISYLEGIG